MRRIPLFATVLVGLAVATMVALGLWQLERKHWKDALLERYAAASGNRGEVPFPRTSGEREAALYRRSSVECLRVDGRQAVSGRNAAGEAGWAYTVRCALRGGGEATVVLGWSHRPGDVEWNQGHVSGVIGPGADGDVRLITEPPQAGLAANATPDPREVPNNHLSYAVQWFLFAICATVIYALAVWKRLAGNRSTG